MLGDILAAVFARSAFDDHRDVPDFAKDRIRGVGVGVRASCRERIEDVGMVGVSMKEQGACGLERLSRRFQRGGRWLIIQQHHEIR